MTTIFSIQFLDNSVFQQHEATTFYPLGSARRAITLASAGNYSDCAILTKAEILSVTLTELFNCQTRGPEQGTTYVCIAGL